MDRILQRVNAKCNAILAGVSMRTGLNLNKPSYICAKMTMQCNSRCAHCDIWKMDFAEDEMTTAQWLSALDSLRRWLGRFAMVFTGGEALLRSDMITILKHAVGLGIRVELLTNGIMVDNEFAEKIVSAGIAQVTLSFDGINPETHDRFRGESGFHEKTSSAIVSLREHRDKSGKPLRILLKTVISANNLEELTAIALFANEHALEVLFQPIEQNYGEEPNADWYKDSNLWIWDIEELKTEVARIQELKRQGFPIVNSVDDLATIIRYFESPEELMAAVQAHDTRSAANTCRHAVTNFVISSNGDVQMCFKMKPIGNLRNSSPDIIWNKRGHCWLTDCKLR
jgi:MoaA/NifB/PqqE/SkfB family radical SAM enzyme